MNFCKNSRRPLTPGPPPLPALISENYVALFLEIPKSSTKIFQIINIFNIAIVIIINISPIIIVFTVSIVSIAIIVITVI